MLRQATSHMTGNIKGFNVAWALKQFLAEGREQENEYTRYWKQPMHRSRSTKADIEQYVRHYVKSNNINDKLRIRISQGLSQL
jgi:hypothetical protein